MPTTQPLTTGAIMPAYSRAAFDLASRRVADYTSAQSSVPAYRAQIERQAIEWSALRSNLLNAAHVDALTEHYSVERWTDREVNAVRAERLAYLDSTDHNSHVAYSEFDQDCYLCTHYIPGNLSDYMSADEAATEYGTVSLIKSTPTTYRAGIQGQEFTDSAISRGLAKSNDPFYLALALNIAK